MISKNRITCLMIALVLTALGQTPRLAHAGTGGGNGDPTGPQQIAQMQKDFGGDAQLVPSSTEPGRRAQELTEIRSHAEQMLDIWCDQIVSFLAKYLKRANIQTQNLRFGRANDIMKNAITVAIQKIQLDPTLASPLTLRMLQRGQDMAAVLDQQVPDSDAKALRTKYEFLKDYLQLVIDQSNQLDRKLVIPYFYKYNACHGGCPTGFNMDDFEHQYIEVAVKELAFPLRFVAETQRDDQVNYVARGNEKVFTNLAQMIAFGVATEIKATFERFADAHTIRDLFAMSTALDGANHGNPSDFLNPGEEIDTTAKNLIRFGKELSDGEHPAPQAK